MEINIIFVITDFSLILTDLAVTDSCFLLFNSTYVLYVFFSFIFGILILRGLLFDYKSIGDGRRRRRKQWDDKYLIWSMTHIHEITKNFS